MDKSKVLIRTAEITGGATITGGLMSYANVKLAEIEPVGKFINNYPEILPGLFVAGGVFLRVSDFGNDDVNNMVEGSIVAGTMGVVDRVLNRFGVDVI
jgi:hypothetical protein